MIAGACHGRNINISGEIFRGITLKHVRPPPPSDLTTGVFANSNRTFSLLSAI